MWEGRREIKQKLSYFLKYNKIANAIYYHIMSFCINVMKLFVKTDDKLILFNSFRGRKYDDSPKAVFDVMKKDPRFKDYKLVWAFHQPEEHEVEGATKIKTDELNYFKTALAARVWVTNSSVQRGLNFKGKNTFYLNTWHGSPIKKMGVDKQVGNSTASLNGQFRVDAMNTQSCFEADIFSRCFDIPRDKFIEVGLPRNDQLVNYTTEHRNELKKKYNYSCQQKISNDFIAHRSLLVAN